MLQVYITYTTACTMYYLGVSFYNWILLNILYSFAELSLSQATALLSKAILSQIQNLQILCNRASNPLQPWLKSSATMPQTSSTSCIVSKFWLLPNLKLLEAGGWLKGVWRVSWGCLEDVLMVSGRCLLGVRMVFGRFLEGMSSVSAGFLESV